MVNSTNVTESNKRTNTQTRTDKRQGESYIPLGINAGGIIIGFKNFKMAVLEAAILGVSVTINILTFNK